MNGIGGNMICVKILRLKFCCQLILQVFHWELAQNRMKYGTAAITPLYGPTKITG